MENDPPMPDPHSYSGLVVCGGAMNVDQEQKYPWLIKEKLFIKRCLDSGIKTLGLCLGAQLMAEVLGAKVAPHGVWEVGWHQINLSAHRFLPATTNTLVAFQWHGYSFDIPAEATAIANSAACKNQGFVYQGHGLAFQFHPESSQEWIQECVNSEDDHSHGGPFIQSRVEILRNLSQQKIQERWYWRVLDLFFVEGQD